MSEILYTECDWCDYKNLCIDIGSEYWCLSCLRKKLMKLEEAYLEWVKTADIILEDE